MKRPVTVLTRAAQILTRTQVHNAEARRCHTKTRLEKLNQMNITPEHLRCCIPP